VPADQEDALVDRLWELGASATYREADPPHGFLAYFPPGMPEPDPALLAAYEGVKLIGKDSFHDEDWLAKSREGFGRLSVGKRFLVKPLWDADPILEGRIPIVVNPGLAFGTGGHETTRLCMEMLEDLAEAGCLKDPVLDIGAGTGILALTAHILGAEDVSAFDNDPDCGPAMEEFIALNEKVLRKKRPYTSFVGTLEDAPVQGRYGLLLANILLETIQDLLPRMAKIAGPGSWLVASGILAERQDEALLSLALNGFTSRKVLREGEWIAILAERT
jgi:ribosomal protein L11 methyltransferase